MRELYLRANSIFALIDAIGVEAAIRSGRATRSRLLVLRDRIDEIAAQWPKVSFVSFGDSLLLKTHWWPGNVELQQQYDYEPETIIDIYAEIDRAYRNALELGTYAVLVQGANEYYQDPLLHISPSNNHVSLNSLGLPFVQLLAIDAAARKAIRAGRVVLLLLGHVSVQTTERYLGCKQKLRCAVNDRLGIEPDATA